MTARLYTILQMFSGREHRKETIKPTDGTPDWYTRSWNQVEQPMPIPAFMPKGTDR